MKDHSDIDWGAVFGVLGAVFIMGFVAGLGFFLAYRIIM